MMARPAIMALTVAAAVALIGGTAGAAAPISFPDVPPWHWAYEAVLRDQEAGILTGYPATPADLIENSITQVYSGFVHASDTGAQAWIERFAYSRPADWPASLQHTQIAGFSLSGMRISVSGDTAESTFTATVRTREAKTVTAPMRVGLRFNGQDWQVDYATLSVGSPLFR